MNRMLKDATVKRYHYRTHDELRQHLATFLMAYNLCEAAQGTSQADALRVHLPPWQKTPERFRLNPHHHTLGPNT